MAIQTGNTLVNNYKLNVHPLQKLFLYLIGVKNPLMSHWKIKSRCSGYALSNSFSIDVHVARLLGAFHACDKKVLKLFQGHCLMQIS